MEHAAQERGPHLPGAAAHETPELLGLVARRIDNWLIVFIIENVIFSINRCKGNIICCTLQNSSHLIWLQRWIFIKQ